MKRQAARAVHERQSPSLPGRGTGQDGVDALDRHLPGNSGQQQVFETPIQKTGIACILLFTALLWSSSYPSLNFFGAFKFPYISVLLVVSLFCAIFSLQFCQKSNPAFFIYFVGFFYFILGLVISMLGAGTGFGSFAKMLLLAILPFVVCALVEDPKALMRRFCWALWINGLVMAGIGLYRLGYGLSPWVEVVDHYKTGFGSRNLDAFFIMLGGIAGSLLAVNARKSLVAAFVMASAGVCFVAVFLSLSRGMIITAAIGGMAIFIGVSKGRKRILVMFLALVLCGVIVVWHIPAGQRAGQVAWQRMSMLLTPQESERDGIKSSLPGRLELVSQSLEAIARNPVTGVGMGKWRSFAQRLGRTADDSHNNYLLVWAELGSVAFFGFLIMMLAPAYACLRMGRTAAGREMRLSYGLLLFCLLFTSFFTNYIKFFGFWVLYSVLLQVFLFAPVSKAAITPNRKKALGPFSTSAKVYGPYVADSKNAKCPINKKPPNTGKLLLGLLLGTWLGVLPFFCHGLAEADTGPANGVLEDVFNGQADQFQALDQKADCWLVTESFGQQEKRFQGQIVSLPKGFVNNESFSLSFRLEGAAPGTVIGRWDTLTQDGRSFLAGVDNQGRIVFSVFLQGQGENIYIARSKEPLAEGGQAHIALVKDSNSIAIYVDGLYANDSQVCLDREMVPAQGPWLLGHSSWLGAMSANVSNLCVYNRALGPIEILNLANRKSLVRHRKPVEMLLYFSFATPRYRELTPANLAVASNSAFDGVCARITGAYDESDPAPEDFLKPAAIIREHGKGKIWPLVFFNRFIGSPDKDPCPRSMIEQKKQPKWARPIQGMDLFDKQGAFSAFLKNYELALMLARDTGAPGIFLDPEAYHCYEAYQSTRLAARHGKSLSQVEARLDEMGRTMADLCHEVYPEAINFFYFLDFGKKAPDNGERSVAVIARGMLNRAKEKGYAFKVVDGWTGRYIYGSLCSARHEVESSFARKAFWLDEYPNLYAASVVSPFADTKKLPKQSWILKQIAPSGKGEHPVIGSIREFRPVFEYLFGTMRLGWVYGAKEAGPGEEGYDIFSEKARNAYDPFVEEALNASRRNKDMP